MCRYLLVSRNYGGVEWYFLYRQINSSILEQWLPDMEFVLLEMKRLIILYQIVIYSALFYILEKKFLSRMQRCSSSIVSVKEFTKSSRKFGYKDNASRFTFLKGQIYLYNFLYYLDQNYQNIAKATILEFMIT